MSAHRMLQPDRGIYTFGFAEREAWQIHHSYALRRRFFAQAEIMRRL